MIRGMSEVVTSAQCFQPYRGDSSEHYAIRIIRHDGVDNDMQHVGVRMHVVFGTVCYRISSAATPPE